MVNSRRRTWRRLARYGRVFAAATAVAWIYAGAIGTQAFTLIGGPASVSVAPISGVPAATFRVTGKYANAPCASGTPLVFTFYWDGTLNFLWQTTVSTCDAARAYNAGPSPALVAPSGDNGVGGHAIILNVTTTAGDPTQNGSASVPYTINSPPPPPPPSAKPPSPRPPSPKPPSTSPPSTHPSPPVSPSTSPGCATVAAADCPSPSPAACNVTTGGLPPPGTGGYVDNLIAASVVAAALLVAGFAMFGFVSFPLKMAATRRVLVLMGLAVLLAATTTCTSSLTGTAQGTPNPIASATPSPSC